MATIAQRVRAARAYGRMSQPAVAEILEMSEKTYKLIELDQRTPKRSELLAIADATGVPMWFLEDGWEGWAKQLRDAAQQASPSEARDPMQVAEEALALVQGSPAPSRLRRTGS